MSEHPIDRPIRQILISDDEGLMRVGFHDITRIEACTKSGMYSPIPYVRVWKGEDCVAEFCQHNILGVYFDSPD